MYEVHISELVLEGLFLEDSFAFICVREKHHVRWVFVGFGKSGGEEKSVCWVVRGRVGAMLEIGAEVPKVGVGLAREEDGHEVGCDWRNASVALD